MNPKHLHRSIMIVAAAALIGWQHSAAAQTVRGEVVDVAPAAKAQNIIITDTSDGESHTVEIRVKDGKTTVIRDGKEVPDAQIIHGDEGIVILDKNGRHIQKIGVRTKSGEAGDRDRFITAYGWLKKTQDEQSAAPPKVMLGVHMGIPGPALEKHLKLEAGKTTMLSGVYEGLPAHDAGLGEYDIIVKVDGQSPADNDSIRKALAEKNAGETITFTVIQEGKSRDVKVKLQEYDAGAMAKAKVIGSGPEKDFWTTMSGTIRNPLIEAPFDGQMLGDLPMIVAPKMEMEWEQLQPKLQAWRLMGEEVRAKGADELEKRLERLDDRLEELEAMLRKFAERQEKKQ